MALESGSRLGLFEILGPLGAGGMGEVYRARDTRLGREVAIKVLPEAFARDPVRVGRFEREARLLASINHPAIAAIYGAEKAGDVRYIVMELVPGNTLAERMARGPLSLEEALRFARQIAEALEAAHERGVVHRDLKPSNIKVTPDGRIKVLDLGLAKMTMEEPSDSADLSQSPTAVVQDQTRPGVILGTAEFMSPEQARGKAVDKRTDIWAFGCILFEMLSGQRAFSGETISDVLVAILSREPDWAALPPQTPGRVRELLSGCLEKDASRRLRDIGDARMEIERVLAGAQEAETAVVAPRRLHLSWLITAAVALLLGGILAWVVLRPRSSPSGMPSEKSLVVLPASVMSDSPGSQLVGDGLVEILSVRLNAVPGIQVVTPTAAVAASDKNTDPFGAARSVGAQLFVRSSVVRSGDRVRIIYSVWNVQTRAQVAGGKVDGSASDLFGMQDQLAENVATALNLPKPAKKTPTPSGLETASQQERYLQALGLLQRYDKPSSIDEAIHTLKTLSSEQPDAVLVMAALGRAYLYKFNLTREKTWAEQAAAAVARSQKLAPDLPEVEATRGELLVRTGRPQEAIAAFRRTLSLQPNNYEALLGLAHAYDKSGDSNNAQATYRRAIALQPTYFGGYSKLAGFFFSRGQYRAAAETFFRVTQLVPDNADAYSNLGGTYQMLGEFERALDAYQRSLALRPTAAAYANLGTLEYFSGKYKESCEHFEKAVAISPKDFNYWAQLGDAYRWLPDGQKRAAAAYSRAIELANGELTLNPRNGFVHSKLALCLAKTGRLSEAEEHARQAAELEPGNPDFMYDAAIIATVSGKTENAVRWLRRAVADGYTTVHIQREPEFAKLRGEKAFQELVKVDKTSSF